MALRRMFADVVARAGHWRLFATTPTPGIPPAALEQLSRVLGAEHVLKSDAARGHHGKDESHFPASLPGTVIKPGSVEEVSECARICSSHRLPMIPFGTGTGVEGGIIPTQGGVTFNLTRMDQVVAVNPEDFTVTVEPGVCRKYLNSYLRDTGLWFPVDPGADASLCGMAATSASGTNAVRYGTMRENVLNLEVVLSDGRVVHTAGPNMRARKTSAGYNLTNLFVGSEGTLGFITRATLRLYSIPEAMVAAVCQFPDVQSAVDVAVMVLQAAIPIARIEFLDDVQMRGCIQYSQLDYKELPTLFFEFHGQTDEVQKQARTVEQMSLESGGSQFQWATETEARNKLWTARHNCLYAALALQPGKQPLTTDVCVPLSKLTEMMTNTKQDVTDAALVGPILGHVGDGNFHTIILYDPADKDEYAKAKELSSKMALRAIELDGTCTGEHGIGIGKKPYLVKEIGEEGIAVMKQIKRTLDPRGLMNPGKVLDM